MKAPKIITHMKKFQDCQRYAGDYPHIFHSNYSPSSQKELYESIARKRKIENAFIYFNNTAGAAGVVDAQDMRLQCGVVGRHVVDITNPTDPQLGCTGHETLTP